MNAFAEWVSSLELTTTQIVSILITFVYFLIAGVAFVVSFLSGQGYRDLARGLRRILERQQPGGDISALAQEVQKYYDTYAKLNPSIHQHYASIINWLDDILLQTNMLTKSKHKRTKKHFIWFDEYYETLQALQKELESQAPFYRCTAAQAQILEDIAGLKREDNAPAVASILKKAEEEFIRLTNEGKKNERTNYISISIGVAGILVSVLLTILQMFG